MKIVTWNVNSIRARLERVLRWLDKEEPDVVCLQELKGTTEAFPFDAIREAGYASVAHGQKTYNGVAILCRDEPRNVLRGLNDDVDDPQARLIAATISGIQVVSAYIPNGKTVGSDKWTYKLSWLRRFRGYLERHCDPSGPLLVCGDFNVVRDDLDAANPAQWEGTVLCHSDARKAWHDIRQWGLTDVFREHHPEGKIYSWWDYRMLGFPKNNGLRIDHILATEPMAAKCTQARVDRDERKGDKPSDHAPVIAVFEDL